LAAHPIGFAVEVGESSLAARATSADSAYGLAGAERVGRPCSAGCSTRLHECERLDGTSAMEHLASYSQSHGAWGSALFDPKRPPHAAGWPDTPQPSQLYPVAARRLGDATNRRANRLRLVDAFGGDSRKRRPRPCGRVNGRPQRQPRNINKGRSTALGRRSNSHRPPMRRKATRRRFISSAFPIRCLLILPIVNDRRAG
jgi:hypothetical protein